MFSETLVAARWRSTLGGKHDAAIAAVIPTDAAMAEVLRDGQRSNCSQKLGLKK